RIFFTAGGRHPCRGRGRSNVARHGARRMDVGSDLRPHRLVSSHVCQRRCLEPFQSRNRALAAVAQPARRAPHGGRLGRSVFASAHIIPPPTGSFPLVGTSRRDGGRRRCCPPG